MFAKETPVIEMDGVQKCFTISSPESTQARSRTKSIRSQKTKSDASQRRVTDDSSVTSRSPQTTPRSSYSTEDSTNISSLDSVRKRSLSVYYRNIISKRGTEAVNLKKSADSTLKKKQVERSSRFPSVPLTSDLPQTRVKARKHGRHGELLIIPQTYKDFKPF